MLFAELLIGSILTWHSAPDIDWGNVSILRLLPTGEIPFTMSALGFHQSLQAMQRNIFIGHVGFLRGGGGGGCRDI